MPAPLKKAAESITKVIPTFQRAITAIEAKHTHPNAQSQTTTSQPWNGWFTTFLADKLGAERFEKLRRLIVFQPDDPNDLIQVFPPSRKFAINDNETAQYRTPSPGSQGVVNQPIAKDPYDISYYTRDTARMYEDTSSLDHEKMKLSLGNVNLEDKAEILKTLEERPNSSRGNKGVFATGKTDFDPTGLRASMSATHEALEESLEEHMPDHLPYPIWWNEQDEIVAWYKERDLPVPIGKTGYGSVPRQGRIARW